MLKLMAVALAGLGLVIGGFAAVADSQPTVITTIVISGSGGLVPPVNP